MAQTKLGSFSLARSYIIRRWFNGLKFGNAPEVAK